MSMLILKLAIVVLVALVGVVIGTLAGCLVVRMWRDILP